MAAYIELTLSNACALQVHYYRRDPDHTDVCKAKYQSKLLSFKKDALAAAMQRMQIEDSAAMGVSAK